MNKKYLLFYLGPFGFKGSEPQITRAEIDQWASQIGDALADAGALFHPHGRTVLDNGNITDAAFPMHGYAIVQAINIEAALEIAKGHPFLKTGTETYFEIEVVEILSGDVPATELQRMESHKAYFEALQRFQADPKNNDIPPPPSEPGAPAQGADTATQASSPSQLTPQSNGSPMSIPPTGEPTAPVSAPSPQPSTDPLFTTQQAATSPNQDGELNISHDSSKNNTLNDQSGGPGSVIRPT